MTFPKKGCWTHRLTRNIPHDSVPQEWQHRQGHWWRSPRRSSLLCKPVSSSASVVSVASLSAPALGYYILHGCHSLSRGHQGELLKGTWVEAMGKGGMLLHTVTRILWSDLAPDVTFFVFPHFLDFSARPSWNKHGESVWNWFSIGKDYAKNLWLLHQKQADGIRWRLFMHVKLLGYLTQHPLRPDRSRNKNTLRVKTLCGRRQSSTQWMFCRENVIQLR